jgi:hypothetical protein
MPTSAMQRRLAATVRFRIRSNGRIVSGTRRSYRRKAAKITADATSAPNTCADAHA